MWQSGKHASVPFFLECVAAKMCLYLQTTMKLVSENIVNLFYVFLSIK